MQTMPRESWTDERLDEFGKRMDDRFDRVDERFNEVDARIRQVDSRFDKMDDRLESMQRTMTFGVIALSSAYIAGFAAIVMKI